MPPIKIQCKVAEKEVRRDKKTNVARYDTIKGVRKERGSGRK